MNQPGRKEWLSAIVWFTVIWLAMVALVWAVSLILFP